MERNIKMSQKKETTNLTAVIHPFPPGRNKIVEAVKHLLENKEFQAITTAEIAKTAGVTEPLIYKYFKDKRDLLTQVLEGYLEQYISRVQIDLKGIKGALNKLRKLIWTHIYHYSTNRIFAKIILLEVKGFPIYFQSRTFQLSQKYGDIILKIIEEGINESEIRDDIQPNSLKHLILGGIERVVLPGLIFNKDISPDVLTENLCNLLFFGIRKDLSGRTLISEVMH